MNKPKYTPIIFSTQMVEAIIAGKKSKTRRLCKFGKAYNIFHDGKHEVESEKTIQNMLPCKYNVGDILWVRETWQFVEFGPEPEDRGYVYKASENGREWQYNDLSWTWKPSLFMPKKACRLFLKVTDVKLERLHDISAEDIKAEGVSYTIDYYPNLIELWENLWVEINGQDSWNENPFVWVVSFDVVEKPADFI